jgi:tetratricopeptide (TPR) repeat protein
MACSPSAEKLNQIGNEAYLEESYDEAQIAYQSASDEDPQLAEPYYNLANVLYRKGGFDQAIEQIEQALSLTSDQALAQNGLYNLGNSTYNLQDWATAIEAYKQALLINPDDQEAKYNLELALLQQEQQQEQENQSEESQDQEESQGQQGQGEQQEQDQSGQDQQNQSQDGSGDPQDQQGSDPAQQGNGSQEGQPEDGQQEGDQPWGALQPGEKMTAEQAQQLLAALMQASQTLQEKLNQIFSVRALPPLQDW